MRKLILSAILSALACGAAYAQLSDREVELDMSGRGKVVDTVAYTAPITPPADTVAFNDKAQECVVRNVKFDDFTARDSARSFVGGYSGRLYQFGDTSVYDGNSNVISFVSATKPLVVARGRQGIGGIGGQVAQFSVTLAAENGVMTILFEDIERAFGNTGSAANTGFNPVYEAWGSGYKQVYSGLDEVAADLAGCMN